MPAGFEARTNTGYIQIIDSLTNYVLLSKGTVVLDAGRTSGITGMTWWSGSMADILIPNTLGYPPIIAFYSEAPISVMSYVLDGANWRVQIVGPYGVNYNGWGVQYFVFGPTPNSAPNNYGLEVRRADGSLAYHSAYFPLKVVGQVIDGANQSYNYGAGRKYGFVAVQTSQQWTAPLPAGTWLVNVLSSMMQSYSDGVTKSFQKNTEVRYSAQPTWTSGYDYPSSNFLVVDLTTQ